MISTVQNEEQDEGSLRGKHGEDIDVGGNNKGKNGGRFAFGSKEGDSRSLGGVGNANIRVSFHDKVVGDSFVKALGFASSLVGDKMALDCTHH
ncbi:hypothetical protein PIB30_012809 [Stylosanthes scabra]|uniref:Uncharacterized protein n=1 Tax=Stylosanthes scabra TaxID=79078 RepID=A0ABU6U593_9FABA|nr:hypothetical protein [Stylosanthes scabra]